MKQTSYGFYPLRLVPVFLVLAVLTAGPAFAARRKEIGSTNIVSGDEQLAATLVTVAPNTIYGGDESRVEIRDRRGNLLAAKEFISKDSSHGGQVGDFGWTPDSQFFVFSIVSSGGYQPWRSRVWFYSRKQDEFDEIDRLLGGRPVLQQGTPFQIIPPHSLRVTTTTNPPSKNEKDQSVIVDLAASSSRATAKPLPEGRPIQHVAR